MKKILAALDSAPETLSETWVLAMEVAELERSKTATWAEIKALADRVAVQPAYGRGEKKSFSSANALQILNEAEALASRKVPVCF